MYEYVKKSEYAPVRKELEQIINRVQVYMRKNYGLTFQFRLIGSGQRHLITRIKGGNRGYDFDYNVILTPPGDGYLYRAKVIKDKFMTAFKVALQGTKLFITATMRALMAIIFSGTTNHSNPINLLFAPQTVALTKKCRKSLQTMGGLPSRKNICF